MRKYSIFNGERKILRSGVCTTASFEKKANDGEFIVEGFGNDVTQKVEFDGLDNDGQPINPRVVDKSPAEMVKVKIPVLKPAIKEKQPAYITNKQWQETLNRIKMLESEV